MLSERTKRILLILGFVASVFAIGAALYFTFFRGAPEAPIPPEPGIEIPTGSLPPGGTAGTRPPLSPGEGGLPPASPIAQGGVTQTTELTTVPVGGLSLAGNNVNYYDPTDSRFYEIGADGQPRRLSERTFPAVNQAAWNTGGSKAVLTFPDQSKIVYDFTNETQVTLPSHWDDVEFSPVKDEIVAKSLAIDPNNRWLVTSNADGSNVRAFQPLGENEDKVQIAWSPNDQVVAFADTAQSQGSLDRKMIIPIGKNQENYKGIIVEGLGFLPNWSPDGTKLLYSASGDYSDSKPLLWVVDATPGTMGANRRSLGLNTWADKCTYGSATTLLCAVPNNLPPNAGLQRVLYRNLPDQLYSVDLASGRSALIAVPETDTTMERLKVAADGRTLFYTNGDTGHLEQIRLK